MQLPGFATMWYNLQRLHLHGGFGIGMFNPGSEDELRQVYEAVGRAEAEMLVRNLDVANENWGYEAFNLVYSNARGPDRPKFCPVVCCRVEAEGESRVGDGYTRLHAQLGWRL